MAEAKRDENRVPTLIAKSDADTTVVVVEADPTTKRLKVTSTATLSNVEYAEDAGHTSGDKGIFVLAVRSDTATQLSGTDLDYSPLITDANGRLHVLDANTASIKTAVELIDNAISGNEMQVDLIGITPDLMIGTDFSNVLGTASLVSATPALKVEQQGSIVVTATQLDIDNLNAADDVVTVTGGIGQTADVKVTLDSEAVVLGAGSASVGILGANSGVDIGDVTINNASGASAVNIQDGGNSITIDGTVTSTPSGVQEVEGDEAEGSGFLPQPILIGGDDGTDLKNINVDATTGDVQVDVTNTVTETNSGAIKTAVELIDNAISGNELQVDVVAALPAGLNAIGKLAANSGVDIGDVDVTSITGVTMSNAAMQVTGDEAHDAVDAGNPVKVGMKAVAHGSSPTAVAASDRTDWYANRHGIPFVIGGHPNIETLVDKNTALGTDEVLKTVNASQKFVVTSVAVMVDNACSVDVGVTLEFDDVTDVKIIEHPGIAAGSGFVWGDGSGILAIGADAQDLIWTNEVPTGGSVTITVTGYLIES